MIGAWFAALWAKVSGWLAIAAAVVLAIIGAVLYGRRKGAGEQKAQDLATAAQADVERANAARDAVTDANAAAAKVRADAAAQPPADSVKRDDLDTTF